MYKKGQTYKTEKMYNNRSSEDESTPISQDWRQEREKVLYSQVEKNTEEIKNIKDSLISQFGPRYGYGPLVDKLNSPSRILIKEQIKARIELNIEEIAKTLCDSHRVNIINKNEVNDQLNDDVVSVNKAKGHSDALNWVLTLLDDSEDNE